MSDKGYAPRWHHLLGLAILAVAASACQEERPAGGLTPEAMVALSADETLPDSLAAGRAAFNKYCGQCHGPAATGSEDGPPFVNRLYHPNHHSDAAFFLAPVQGVRAHHWRYGNMLPVEGVTREEVGTIISYVRWLQREAGIY